MEIPLLWVPLLVIIDGKSEFVARLGPNEERKHNTYFSIYENFKWVSSGRDAVLAVSATGNLYSLENMSFDDSDNMQSELLFLSGHVNKVSVHRGVAWMVKNGNSLRKFDVDSARTSCADNCWQANVSFPLTQIDNDVGISQIDVGEFGVFGTTDNGEIYYRVGTHRNTGSDGNSWQRIHGTLSHISSGINNVYGIGTQDSRNIYKLTSEISFNEQGEIVWNGASRWEYITEKQGTNISVL